MLRANARGKLTGLSFPLPWFSPDLFPKPNMPCRDRWPRSGGQCEPPGARPSVRLAISDSHIQSAPRTTLVDNLSAQGVNMSKRSRMVEQVLPPSRAIEGSRRLLDPG